MSSDSSDDNAPTSPSQPPKPSSSPPLADTVVRPFTSQGSTFSGSRQPLTYTPPYSSDDRPSTGHGSPVDPSNAKLGPYMSASARTSYTRVDVDSLPVPEYPPLPPLPTAFAAQDVPATAAPPAITAATTASSVTPAPDAPTSAVTEPSIPQTPQVSLTFLLVSGHRKSQSFDPETTVGRVKELVWNAWPTRDADWQDERPPAPVLSPNIVSGKDIAG
ncbi:hypothetical protein JVT61DRAFT_10495 [Boletus reticuloceps]|uniref:Uncharacterized protein n=1 Tax=Boletus reticuloceps TaxID=495285 RepID=A0A8I3AC57_9AGAM|nr:hypothetical protein JVT61DRAFT_10495 [Boletus reticuloceps]